LHKNFLSCFTYISMKDQENISAIDQYVIDFVKNLRNDKNLTQQDIADIIGLSRGFISEVEGNYSRAKYNVRHINALADYFGISPKEFLPTKAFPVEFEDKGKKIATKNSVKQLHTKSTNKSRKKV
jgi:transcriptional regulator with XRE-family HTH domain